MLNQSVFTEARMIKVAGVTTETKKRANDLHLAPARLSPPIHTHTHTHTHSRYYRLGALPTTHQHSESTEENLMCSY